jgi:tripeptidyl-peptidase-1
LISNTSAETLPSFIVFYYGSLAPSGGTSAACPTFSGIVALLNDARLRAGKPALGFLNPLLYSLGSKALNDITAGGSVGCDGINPQTGQPVPGASIIPGAHWNATEGWDPVTGLGTPNFEDLKKLVLSY